MRDVLLAHSAVNRLRKSNCCMYLFAANQEAIATGGGILATLQVMGKHKTEAKLIEAAAGLLAMLAIHPGTPTEASITPRLAHQLNYRHKKHSRARQRTSCFAEQLEWAPAPPHGCSRRAAGTV